MQRRERRAALWRLFVAGFGAMQVMMLAWPSYTIGGGDAAEIDAGIARIGTPVAVDELRPKARSAHRVAYLRCRSSFSDASDVQLVIADTRDPLHPKPLSEFTEGVTAGVHSAFIYRDPRHGTHVYLTNNGTNAMHVVDISDPYNPREVAQWRSPSPGAGGSLHDIDVQDGLLYVADRDGATGEDDPGHAVIRKFDIRTGTPAGELPVKSVGWINDIAVAADGSIYATQTGAFGENPDPSTWAVWRIAPDGAVSVFAQGAPLFQPNGVAIDHQGNIVVVNMGNPAVLTFSASGELLRTEQAAQAGSDGLVIMPDGTKYVSSVRFGGVSRMRPGQPAELIARNIPSAASMCHDAGANQLVIPMNANNALAFVRLDP